MAFGRTIFALAVALGMVWMPATVPAAERKPGVVAVVNGSDIDGEEFNRELNRVQRMVLNTGKALTCPQVERLRTEVVEGLIRRELLYQEGRKKVQVSEAEVNEELKKLKEQYPSETDFTNALTVMKISPATFRAQVEKALAIQKIIETQFASKAVVTDKEIWAYYDRNRDSFRQPEQIRASHILIRTPDPGNPGSADPKAVEAKRAEAKKKIEEIRTKIQQGEDFASLARMYSEDPSSAKGGDLGYVRTGQLVKPFEEALFALKPGEVSEVVETRLGYHLIKAVDRKPEMTIPFEKLKDQLRLLLKQEKGQQEANAYIGKMREKAKVEIFLPDEK